MRVSGVLSLALLGLLAGPAALAATEQQPMSDEEVIADAMAAAPEAVARHATIVAVDEQGEMRTIREGTNNFTCMPDNPQSPGRDPMCLDTNGMAWAHAWMTHTEPPKGQVGFGYMLQGGSDASNEDPFASAPAEGRDWVDTGPHVMLFNVGDAIQDYPTQKDHPDTSQPYVMWAGTPYEHLMIPVE
jgi:hypothetical protein